MGNRFLLPIPGVDLWRLLRRRNRYPDARGVRSARLHRHPSHDRAAQLSRAMHQWSRGDLFRAARRGELARGDPDDRRAGVRRLWGRARRTPSLAQNGAMDRGWDRPQHGGLTLHRAQMRADQSSMEIQALTPMLRTWDIAATIEFYTAILGFVLESQSEEWASL